MPKGYEGHLVEMTRHTVYVATVILTMVAARPSWAEPFLCPPENDLYFSEPGKWHHDYIGFLKEVQMSSGPAGTIVSCRRDIGSVSGRFGKSCQLLAGETRNRLEKTPDAMICTLSSNTEKTNDKQCVITCEP